MDYGDYNVFDGLELMVQITPCTVDESLNLYLKNVAIILVMYQRGENVTTCYIMCKKKSPLYCIITSVFHYQVYGIDHYIMQSNYITILKEENHKSFRVLGVSGVQENNKL